MSDLGFKGNRAPHIVAEKKSKSASKIAVKNLKIAGEVLDFLQNPSTGYINYSTSLCKNKIFAIAMAITQL